MTRILTDESVYDDLEFDEAFEPICEYCGGDGGDPLNDYVLPCPMCQ